MSLLRELGTLEAAGFIQLAQTEPELAYLFRHTLLQEAAYTSLPKAEQRQLHQIVGETLEQQYQGHAADISPVLAHHFEAAGDRPRALQYYLLAGERAVGQFALAEALEYFNLALRLAEAGSEQAEIRRQRGLIYDHLGDFDQANADLQAAVEIAGMARDQHLELRALLDLGLLWASRDYTRTGEYYRQALALARESGDAHSLANSLNQVGNWYVNRDMIDEALPYHQEALKIFQELDDVRGIAATNDLLGLANGMNGNFKDGLEHFQKAESLFRELDELPALISVLTTIAIPDTYFESRYIFVPYPFPFDLQAKVEEGLALARQIAWPSGEVYALFVLAQIKAGHGEYRAALDDAQASLQIASEIEHYQWKSAASYVTGAIYLDLLDVSTATRYLQTALDLAEQVGSLPWLRMSSGELVVACIASGQLERAEAVMASSLEPDTPATSGSQRQVWCARADLALAQGDVPRSLEIIARLKRDAVNKEDDAEGGNVGYLHARILAAAGDYPQAEAVYQLALRQAEQHRLSGLKWRLLVGLGALYRVIDQPERAEQAFEAARVVIWQIASGLPEGKLRQQFEGGAYAMIDQG
jgi:tetratricopeptide (TPR) repeat protein